MSKYTIIKGTQPAAALLALTLSAGLFGTTACKKKENIHNGTPESTIAPAQNVDELFKKGDKEYFVPFQNPEHSYCTISDGLGTPVRSQGWGGCYAFSAVASMQSGYLKRHGELIDLNPLDVVHRIYEVVDKDASEKYPEEKYYVSGITTEELGGDVKRVVGAMCADPLNGYVLENVDLFPDLTNEDIKELIRKYGAMSIAVDYQRACKDIHGYRTQNYDGTDTNHIVTIVGWDDDFPSDGFVTPASQNGAWFVQNTFGTGWGNNGYYWISYDQVINALANYEVTDEYSSGLSYGRFAYGAIPSVERLSGLDGNMDLESVSEEEINSWENVSVATVYEKKGTLAAVGLWSFTQNQPYTIEIYDGRIGENGEMGDLLAKKSGSFENYGYHTVKLDTPLKVKTCTVVVRMAGAAYFEGPSEEVKVSSATTSTMAHYEAKTEPGRSFIESDGTWIDVTDPELKTKLGLDAFPIMDDVETLGDPCITVLYE